MTSEPTMRHDPERRQHPRPPGPAVVPPAAGDTEACVHCGWGRLLFGQTFADASRLVGALATEAPDERDVAVYVSDPHVALALAPQDVFLDPSHTLRLSMARYQPRGDAPRGFDVRRAADAADAAASNRLYARLGMVQVPLGFYTRNLDSRELVYLVAEDDGGRIIGSVSGVDHVAAFGDPDQGSSLWCLAVDPECSLPGVGDALVRALAEHFQSLGRQWMDLSVMHDNVPALKLYERIGFERIALFTLKKRNPINEQLFIAPEPEVRLNPYARIIINEARRRGIAVQIEDETSNLFRLSFGGRTVSCRESLSDMTSAVAVARCDDKALTRRLLARAGLVVPEQIVAAPTPGRLEREFLETHRRIVVKPARGEQGAGIAVDLHAMDATIAAIAHARQYSDTVLLERFCEGQDLRVVVIDTKVVAAALRRPAHVVGNGRDRIERLIESQSRRRAATTGGESRIPLDDETRRCVALAGFSFEDVLDEGQVLAVRRTANLHTGGTLHDVTDRLSKAIKDAALKAASVLEIPVVGLDLLVPDPAGDTYVMIEANERPGLANHEPHPTAERFIDLLFPQTRRDTGSAAH
jgi:GNAT-family acetyltransferase (TIGR03103 family)